MAYEEIPVLPDNPHPLGRHVNHDPASLNYLFSAIRPEAQLTVASKEWTRRSPIFDQGNLGSCTGNAGAGWEATDDAERPGVTGVTEADAVSLYSDATKIDPYAGQYPPTDTGSDGLSIAKVLKSRGVIDQYTHGTSTTDVQIAIQSTPVLIGVPWYEGMFNPDAHGVVSISGQVAGGHEIIVVGYDHDGSLGYPAPYKLANSWGTGWGDQGFFYMTEATLSRLLSEQGDCTVLHAIGTTPPQPTKKVITKIDVVHLSGRHSTVNTVRSAVVHFSDGTSVNVP